MISLYVVLVPLAVALLVTLLRANRPFVQALAVLGGVATFALALFLPGSEPVDAAWLPGLGVSFALDATGAGAVLVLVAALVMIPTLLVAATRVERNAAGFVALLLLAQAGLNGIFLAKDLIVFYVFWEATLIPALLLLGVYGGERRRQATLKYLVYAVAGSFLMLVSILALKGLSGAASFHVTDLMLVTPGLAPSAQTWLFVGMAVGMVVKLPLWPLHSWLVDLNEQNHPSGAADVLGSLYKVGAFGFFAWALPLLPAGALNVAPVLLALAAITAVYGALAAVAQEHLKRFLAYGSLSHMGIIGVGLFGLHLAGLNGAIYFLAAQMVSTSALFLVAGMLWHRRRSFLLRDYGGLAKGAPALAAVSLFLIFAYIGVPGLSNFPGEFMSLL
ncbi:MAG: NADH-quinone oxidoreductase subunit M, partial [Deinococcales bacterium]|nr:NADH-quinone oxidoreductase subunit M [Deinococcales bacterium]